MVFKPGHSGNPYGDATIRVVTDALRLASKRKDKRGKAAINRMAEKIMRAAIKGEPWACHFVADRLEGKVPQPVQSEVTFGPSQMFLEIIRAISQGRVPEGLVIDAERSDLVTDEGGSQ